MNAFKICFHISVGREVTQINVISAFLSYQTHMVSVVAHNLKLVGISLTPTNPVM